MPRKKRIYTDSHPYHIVARSNRSQWFEISHEDAWNVFSDYLYFVSHAYKMRVHAFTMMANHFHLVASFPEGNLPIAMNRFMTEIARQMNFLTKQEDHFFGNRHCATVIRDVFYYANVYRYVLRNPVEANICSFAEDYPFSSLYRRMGFSHLGFPVYDRQCELIPDFLNLEEHLAWINKVGDRSLDREIEIALQRTDFEFSGAQIRRLIAERGREFANQFLEANERVKKKSNLMTH